MCLFAANFSSKFMSNLSDIGFSVESEQDVNQIIENLLTVVKPIACSHGAYYIYTDVSGAEMYLQGNLDDELIGFNPHFAGKSRRCVGLTKMIERDSSKLDGGFYAWANPGNEDVETSGEYPFVFDVPDFRTIENLQFPRVANIQLTAFASNDFKIFADETEYDENREGDLKYASKSFVPSGLFNFDSDNWDENAPPRPIGIFTGEIKEFELKINELSGEKFYWFLIDTFGGETDVVADTKLIPNEPKIGGIVSGQFWLSGRLLEE